MAYSFDDADAPSGKTQYFEMFCNRGIYHQGWTAVTRHIDPVGGDRMPPFDDDVWELYGPDDWTQAHDLAGEQPEKLTELQRLFLDRGDKVQRAATRRPAGRAVQPRPRRRPQLINGNSQLLFGGMGRLSENSVIASRTSPTPSPPQVDVPDGWSAGRDRRPGRCIRRLGASTCRRASRPTATTSSDCSGSRSYGRTRIPAGEHQVRMEFAYDGGGLGKGGTVTLYVDGERSATAASTHRADDLLGRRDDRRRHDNATPVSDDYSPSDRRLHRSVEWVQIDIDEAAEDLDHLITPEERLRIAMARQ